MTKLLLKRLPRAKALAMTNKTNFLFFVFPIKKKQRKKRLKGLKRQKGSCYQRESESSLLSLIVIPRSDSDVGIYHCLLEIATSGVALLAMTLSIDSSNSTKSPFSKGDLGGL